MSETVFILGAGASQEAGAPLMNDFIDVAYDLRKRLTNENEIVWKFDLVFKALTALEASVAKANIDLQNVESVFAAFEMAKLLGRLGSLSVEEVNNLPMAMTKVIERTLEETISFPVTGVEGQRKVAPPIPYGDFVELIQEITDGDTKPQRVSILTFNYDVCLDYALHFNSLPVNYGLDEQRKEGIKLFKLHGSTSWILCPGCNQVVPWYLEQFFTNRNWRLWPEDASKRLDVAAKTKEFKHCGDTPAAGPMLIPPTWNKAEYHRQLSNVWRAAAAEFADAENIIVSGYSLPETDHFFRYLYALGATGGGGRLKRFLVFDPDKDVESKFKSLLGPLAASRFCFYDFPFKGAIPTVRNILGIKSNQKRA